MPTVEERVVGCLLGGAIGDAMGAPYEGQAGPLRYVPPTRSRFTDDTELTIATCEAIVEHRSVDPERVAARYAVWFRDGRIHGIGSSTLKALRDLTAGAHWALCGATGEFAAGNGAAMRAAPLAFVLDPDSAADCQVIRDVSRITHRNDEAYVGALAVVVAVRSILDGAWPNSTPLLEFVAARVPDSAVRERLEACAAADGTPAALAERFGASGYVVDSVPIAIRAAQDAHTAGFAAVVENSITAGGDTDTIASMAGQIAGAFVGADKLPPDLLDRIDDVSSVLPVVESFAAYVADSGLTGAWS